MIELSKCPNCAAEDKVTIAGKDFCMRCGTPSQDPTQAADTTNTTPPPAADSSTPPQADQNPASVSKFTDPATATTTLSQPTNDATAAAPPSANMPPVADAPPQIDDGSALPPQGVEQPAQAPAQPVMPTMQQAVPTVQDPSQYQTPSPTMAPAPAPIPTPASDSPVAVVSDQTTQAQSPILGQAASIPEPTNIPSPPVQQVASAMPINPQPEQPAPMPAPIQQPDVNTTPDPVQIPSDQALTQPATTPEPIPVPEVAGEPRIHTHQAIMSLDKNDSGVFSDEQLDELSKISDQSEPLGAQADQPKANVANHGSTTPATFHTDIQPPSESKPSPTTQSAVSKVVDNEVKVPDKNNKGKKVLKPAGIALSIVALFFGRSVHLASKLSNSSV